MALEVPHVSGVAAAKIVLRSELNVRAEAEEKIVKIS